MSLECRCPIQILLLSAPNSTLAPLQAPSDENPYEYSIGVDIFLEY
jgi:hypothetical protein